ncbi:unnamed protein product [Rhizopus stolonifer]
MFISSVQLSNFTRLFANTSRALAWKSLELPDNDDSVLLEQTSSVMAALKTKLQNKLEHKQNARGYVFVLMLLTSSQTFWLVISRIQHITGMITSFSSQKKEKLDQKKKKKQAVKNAKFIRGRKPDRNVRAFWLVM